MRGNALAPLRHKNFRLLASARTIDYLGNGMAPIALSFAVLDRTGSVTDLGLVVGARSVANVLLLLIGGVLADRFPRAAVLQGSATLAAVSQAVALQRNIPEDKLARVYSYDALGSFIAIPLGQVAAGPVALAIGDRATLAIAAALIVLVTVATLVVPSVWRLEFSDHR